MPRQLARRRASADTAYDADDVDEREEKREEERPRGRRSRRDADEEETQPRGRRSRRDRDEEDDEPSPRRGRRSRDDDDEPRRGRRSSREDEPQRAKAKATGGWNTVEKNRAARYSNPGRLQVKDKELLLKFLEAEPFATYGQHWVGQRSYTCGMNADYEKCPLCSIGNPVRYLALFNVVDVDSGENRYWEVGPEATKTLMEFHEEPRTSPLDKDGLYFTAKRFKKDNGFYGFKIGTIKGRDLDDEFGLDPLGDDELDEAMDQLFDDSVVPVNSLSDLKAAAREDESE